MNTTQYSVGSVTYYNTFDYRGEGEEGTVLSRDGRPRSMMHLNYLQQTLSDRLQGQDAEQVNSLLNDGVETLRTDLKQFFEDMNVSVVISNCRTTDPRLTTGTAGRFITLQVTVSDEEVTETFAMIFNVNLTRM